MQRVGFSIVPYYNWLYAAYTSAVMSCSCVWLQANQRDLEQATEQLSEYLERDITSDILVDIKQKVQDKYRYDSSCSDDTSSMSATLHIAYTRICTVYFGIGRGYNFISNDTCVMF